MSVNQFFTSREEYIAVLENEVEILRRYYYSPSAEGTGHYNTAISVLTERINELRELSKAA
jgi:outer membrane protein assembly factor BamD (BamD/ComL family)